METPQKLKQLFIKYINNECTPAEAERLMKYFHAEDGVLLNRLVLDELEKDDYKEVSHREQQSLEKVYHNIHKQITQQKNKQKNLWPRVAIAASVLLCLSVGGYFLSDQQQQKQTAQFQKADLLPGKNQATLTLANGQKIILTGDLKGKIAQQGNTMINVSSARTITYTESAAENQAGLKVAYNTLSTNVSEQSPYPLILADGTKVWLNASSSVTFPTSFRGKNRKVTVTGEAYFEVAHNAAKPFSIAVKGQTIEDIGTQFNVNAYNNEPVVKTTLLEGSVKVSTGLKSVILKPGQQAVTKNISEIELIKTADTEEAVSWKKGYFRFNDERIESIMRQLARWYDVEIQYQGDITKEQYNGTIARAKNISQVLKMLEATKTVHFKIDGRRITVMQK